MDEFNLIEKFCRRIGVQHAETLLGVGDDAAIVQVPDGMQLAVSVDTLVEDVHFTRGTTPDKLAKKLLAVNLSDMAAMGADPKWATICLSMPQAEPSWMEAFSKSLHDMACEYQVELIGGDTTRGPLTLSLQIMGLLPQGQALSRAGAKAGDDLFVTGQLGDAALALKCLGDADLGAQLDVARLRIALDLPQPQIAAGRALLSLAHSCIDISDGLVADLSHIASASDVSLHLDVNTIPVSSEYRRYLQIGGNYDLALSGGDDYQLAFSATPEQRAAIEALQSSIGVSISRIGQVVAAGSDAVSLMQNGSVYQLSGDAGYRHFQGEIE